MSKITFTAKSASIKDFLYGSLFKATLVTAEGNIDVYVYHDHVTEQVNILFTKLNYGVDQCNYQQGKCITCKNNMFRLYNNACVQQVINCDQYTNDQCTSCNSTSQSINGVCIAKASCGALCEVTTI